jgi:hypothetical protein
MWIEPEKNGKLTNKIHVDSGLQGLIMFYYDSWGFHQ